MPRLDRLIAQIVSVDGGVITGWLKHEGGASLLDYVLEVDGIEIARGRADIVLPALSRVMPWVALHGFVCRLPMHCLDGRLHRLSLRLSDDGSAALLPRDHFVLAETARKNAASTISDPLSTNGQGRGLGPPPKRDAWLLLVGPPGARTDSLAELAGYRFGVQLVEVGGLRPSVPSHDGAPAAILAIGSSFATASAALALKYRYGSPLLLDLDLAESPASLSEKAVESLQSALQGAELSDSAKAKLGLALTLAADGWISCGPSESPELMVVRSVPASPGAPTARRASQGKAQREALGIPAEDFLVLIVGADRRPAEAKAWLDALQSSASGISIVLDAIPAKLRDRLGEAKGRLAALKSPNPEDLRRTAVAADGVIVLDASSLSRELAQELLVNAAAGEVSIAGPQELLSEDPYWSRLLIDSASPETASERLMKRPTRLRLRGVAGEFALEVNSARLEIAVGVAMSTPPRWHRLLGEVMQFMESSGTNIDATEPPSWSTVING